MRDKTFRKLKRQLTDNEKERENSKKAKKDSFH